MPLGIGRRVDALNRLVQRGVKLSVGLLSRKDFGKSPRKARDNAMIPAQAIIGFFSRIAA